MNDASASEPVAWTRAQFEQELRSMERYYHIHHPFNVLMTSGKLDENAVRGWVANRFYYQVSIPIKDAVVLSNCPDREVRRRWISRIIDHDGTGGAGGGIDAWLALGEAVGLTREELWSHERVVPGVRFAVDAYVNFARRATWQEAACSSLTELFAPAIHQQRLDRWPEHYPWIQPEGYAYFRQRLQEARRDVEHGLAITLDTFRSRTEQSRALGILKFKLDVLWTMLDVLWLAYVDHRPPYFNVVP
ncbi:MAG: pyrroloquinoline-quinone synthase PqqC [Gammaproteobacteria bacterium]